MREINTKKPPLVIGNPFLDFHRFQRCAKTSLSFDLDFEHNGWHHNYSFFNIVLPFLFLSSDYELSIQITLRR